jgi:hypothetical protein
MPCELKDRGVCLRPNEESSDGFLVSACREEVFSCSIVVRRVLEGVLHHNNFVVVPSIMKGVVLVKLPNKSDAACLHHHVYEWKDHAFRFSKVDKMLKVPIDISHDVHGLVSFVGHIL